GLWVSTNDGAGPNTRPELTPEGQRVYAANKAGIETGTPEGNPSLRCLPQGFPRMMTRGLPMALAQSENILVMTGEASTRPRVIYIGGKHNPDMWPTFMGESIAHWDKDALVVDTVKVRTEAFLDSDGLPHTEDLHTVEHLKLADSGKTLIDE